MKFAAVADIHYPKYKDLFLSALEKANLHNTDLFFLCGDIVYKSKYAQLKEVVNEIRKKYSGQIIGCFGNEEYQQHEEQFKGEVLWLNDECKDVKIKEEVVSVIGSRGSLDQPTSWQSKNIPKIKEIYENRVKHIENLISTAKGDYKIVLTHYTPTYKTQYGEKSYTYKYHGTKKFEPVIEKTQPDIWIHGHAHNSKVLKVQIGKTRILNVALFATKRITTLFIDKGLKKFI